MSGKGPYKFRKRFERYSADDFQKGQLTGQQRLRKADVFKKAAMNDKEEFTEEYASQCSSKQDLSLSAKDCKIDKGPLRILEVMFEKAASLIQIRWISYSQARVLSWLVCCSRNM